LDHLIACRADEVQKKTYSHGLPCNRRDPILDLKFVVLSHNTIRGAAGGSIYNVELLVNENLL